MDYIAIHKKWRDFWRKNETNKFDANSKKPKYYSLEMFPYPSGATLHLGHFYVYAVPDTHARFKRMSGFNVFHPFGFDAFGLPAENHALKTGTHPHDNTVQNMEIFRRQMEQLGGMYDWDYSFATCFPDYYKWTQWLFLQLYNAGLAYRKEAPVNWCDKCKTVLANEQVLGGQCERCESEVVRKNMTQWFFKITDYADELLTGLDNLDWPNKTKVMQRNWIGRSEGARVRWPLANGKGEVETFTTRIDTIFGATFLVIAPEHPAVSKITTPEHEQKIGAYIRKAAAKSDIERMEHSKTGEFTGSFAINPATKEQIPIYVADYVLYSYGTGVVQGCPAHDERDFDFAVKHGLAVKYVLRDKTKNDGDEKTATCCGHDSLDNFILCNSGQFDGLTSTDALQKITAWLEKQGLAEFQTTYRLRDWGIGRQRYWGAPIPIVYCDKCGIVPVPEAQLPVELPYINDFRPKGAAPLASVSDFVNTTCPKCGGAARRETDTMDTFVCSSWYFLRFPDAKNDKEPFSKTNIKMFPIDKYIGGAEHACCHLLYARFITRFLYKQGLLPFAEPFTSLVHQGMILAHDGSKMSKSKGNTKTPDEYVDKYGSDILRLFMLFGFNYGDGGPWNDNTLKTVTRFTERVESLVKKYQTATPAENDPEILYIMANTIKQVRQDLESFSFNTAVARCMEMLNAVTAAKVKSREAIKTLVLLLAPMIPHIAEEYWEMIGGQPSIFNQSFPVADEKYLSRDTVEIAVQINSKIITRIIVANSAPQSDIEKAACSDEKMAAAIAGRNIKKVIYISGKLINFII